MTATTTAPTTPATKASPEQGTSAPGTAPEGTTATPGTGPGTEADRHDVATAQDDGAPTRRALRVSAPPRPAGPAGYPEASTRPAPRTRRVRVGTPGVRRDPDDDQDLTARPLREAAPAPLPDPTAQCCTVVRAAIEVLRGERPAAQLARWVTPQVRDQLAERARIGLAHAPLRDAAHHRPVQVRRVRLVRLGDDVAEATVVLDDDGRVRAAAVRLEARRGAWRVAVLEIG
ncbi:Rv3235 family protein [Isoptericola sp. NPDC056578]|uniref:Rv3235 family protein n=1 Tax=Isoptericola sp. NPDC056578 TaxID=3345870 RepID=UPI003698F6F1